MNAVKGLVDILSYKQALNLAWKKASMHGAEITEPCESKGESLLQAARCRGANAFCCFPPLAGQRHRFPLLHQKRTKRNPDNLSNIN